jgi:O-antigen/teichoic acid export membrane protein
VIPLRRLSDPATRAASRDALGARLLEHVRTPLFRTGYALMLSNIMTSGLGLVYWILAARLYAPQFVGLASALISTMVFLSGVSQLNIRSALNRFIPVAGPDKGRVIAIGYLITLPAAVVVISGYLLATGSAPSDVTRALTSDAVLLAWFALSTATWGILNIQDGVLTGLRRAWYVPVENTLYSIAKMILLVAFAAPFATYGIFVSWTIPALATVFVVTLLIFGKLVRPERGVTQPPRQFTAQTVARYVAGDYGGALFVLAYTSLLPVLVINAVGATQAAYFYIVWTMATSLNLLPLSLAISHTVETVADGSDPLVRARQVLVHMSRTLLPIVVAVVVLAPFILSLFGPGYAAAGSDLLRLLAIGVVPYAINVVYFSLSRIRTRMRGVLVSQAVLACSTIGLTIAFIGPFGLAGVGYAWLISQSSVAIVVLATVLRPAFRRTLAL